ncbi:MAG: glutamine--fructose-6-phosphate transaminase (isomerizing) [Gammaproteobacteria bacterium]
MCGIVGAVMKRPAAPVLIEGLQRLEYRGYDSAGIAIYENDHLVRIREQGKVANLAEALQKQPLTGHVGIAHTRWATHGAPSEQNAHPHISGDGESQVAVVHNGIIENHEILRAQLAAKGYVFVSQTDTEVIAHLIHACLGQGLALRAAVLAAMRELEGAFSLGVLSCAHPEELIAVRKGSPLVIGLGEGEHYFASDYLALIPVTQRFIYLEEGDMAEVKAGSVEIYNEHGAKTARTVNELSSDAYLSGNKGNYKHFMQKEIFEQPHVVQETLEGRLGDTNVLDAIFGPKTDALFAEIECVHIIACGTSYHAGMVARYGIESIVGIPCSVEVSSEYRYRDVVVPKNTLFVCISQSGETADTLAALRKAKTLSYRSTLAICNVPESIMVREANHVFLTRAGREVCVASTKAFCTQLVSLALLTLSLAKAKHITDIKAHVEGLKQLPRLMERVLKLDAEMLNMAHAFVDKTSALFVARGILAPIALEGALKLKEISYIHAEAYPAGELKHGPLALVDESMPVVGLLHHDRQCEKMLSNLQEIKARGGQLFLISDLNDVTVEGAQVIKIPLGAGLFAPALLHTLPLQLLAYHVAVMKGADVDQPRNLAKSVTVE